MSESFGEVLFTHQVAELAELVQALPEDRCEPELMLCDPCGIPTLEIDTDTYVDHCCGNQVSPGYADAFQALADYLDSLVPPQRLAWARTST